MPLGAGIGLAGLTGAGATIWGANQAANAQTNAANMANQTIQQQYQTNSANLAPWIQGGANTNNILSYLLGTSGGGGNAGGGGASSGSGGSGAYTGPLGVPIGLGGGGANAGAGAGAGAAPGGPGGAGQGLQGGGPNGFGSLTAAFQPTMAQLQSTPGYQFTLGQGLKSVQNSYAAKGLGGSGAALKGAADYATGDANSTYNQQFSNYWNQNQSIYNMLTGQSQQGLSGASALAGVGTTAAGQQSANLVGAGNAQASMYNATGGAIAGLGNNLTGYALLNNYLTNGTGSGNLSPSQFQTLGNAQAGSLTDAQANAYGNYMGFA